MVYPIRGPARPMYPMRGFPVRQYPAMPQQNKPSSQKHIYGYVIAGAVIVILLLLVFFQFTSKEKSDLVGFKEELESDLSSASMTGAITKNYALPDGYSEVCFTDVNDVDAANVIDNWIIQRSVVRKSLKNVFLLGDNKKTSFYIQGLNVASFPHYSCARVEDGKVQIQLNSDNGKVVAKLPVNSNYCKNAQEKKLSDGRNLCSYLDSVYYQGYKGECCSSYGYCC
ncbi:hypothetical protein HYT23_05010 [Candidatus Pacearchaeota archaeon]|nr:hypothetical protein [Candidatus Pacearchaeota archaeon]